MKILSAPPSIVCLLPQPRCVSTNGLNNPLFKNHLQPQSLVLVLMLQHMDRWASLSSRLHPSSRLLSPAMVC